MRNKIITKSFKETQKIGEKLADEILKLLPQKSAIILGLNGNLGGGKTTFLQGFAKGLGIKEKILSPTFVIYKKFIISPILINKRTQNLEYRQFYHFDCYRIKNYKDFLAIGFSAQGGPASGWKEIISNPKNIVAIEWPEKIKKIFPKTAVKINFKFINESARELTINK
ncbi:MAG: tRNA (adenosine(37)-N6)-threonylcarbamoyltransferase complex ATPase subunit type 1 TsaE [Patescibacteria group bacterium]